MSVLLVLLVVSWCVVAVATWLGYRLIRQNGEVLQRVASLEHYLTALRDQVENILSPDALPAGLSPGIRAPVFALPDLGGTEVSIEEFHGRRVLLIFFSPTCNFCREMAPDLAALPPDGGAGGPVPVVVTTGDPQTNRAFFQEHGIRCRVLLQEGNSAGMLYGALGTPVAYLLDEQGLIASRVATGISNVLALAKIPSPAASGGNGHRPPGASAAADLSAVTRPAHHGSGLNPGAQAPLFKVRALNGGVLLLDDYRGRRRLLVFSDPDCPACEQIIPELQRRHGGSSEFQILLLTRGSLEENRAKAAAQGLTFPVGVQQHREVSRLYRKFATPAAYLIDEGGLIAAPVAVGGAILTLAAQASRLRPAEKKPAPMSWRNFRGGGGESAR